MCVRPKGLTKEVQLCKKIIYRRAFVNRAGVVQPPKDHETMQFEPLIKIKIM